MARSGALVSMASVASTLLTLLGVLAWSADANAFLGRVEDSDITSRVGPQLEKALIAEIEEVLGSDHRRATEGRLGRIEEALLPTFVALPKNEHGLLAHATVRYAMHRLFLKRHGWFVRGLEPGGEAWNATSPTVILQDHLPDYVQELFERRLGNHGLELHEVAVMAATLENLVHKEAMERLHHTYRLLNRSVEDPVSQEESHEVIDRYMVGYILGFNFSVVSLKEAERKHQRIEEAYPTWPETQKFLRTVQASAAPNREELSFENVASIIEEVGERYGRWQDSECRSLKNELVKLEDQGTGRVRLGDFYSAAVKDGKWQFSESVDYLRQLGALDESDAMNLRVMIPNYINSPSNCVASSKYYSVCCLNECEEILGHLEEKLGTPHAAQRDIAALVAALPSATTAGNRTLSTALLGKLSEVADRHNNRIPLHGRLFAQWMHLAYPRECPFPHVTGTTAPNRPEDWMASSGQEVSASREEMQQHMESSPRRSVGSPGDGNSEEEAGDSGCGLWTMEEELVSVHSHARPMAPEPDSRSGGGAFRGVAFVAAVISLTLALFRIFGSAFSSAPSTEPVKLQAASFSI